MARAVNKKPTPKKKTTPKKKRSFADRITAARRFVRRWALRSIIMVMAAVLLWVSYFVWFNPKKTPYMRSEELRIGGEVDYEWVYRVCSWHVQ